MVANDVASTRDIILQVSVLQLSLFQCHIPWVIIIHTLEQSHYWVLLISESFHLYSLYTALIFLSHLRICILVMSFFWVRMASIVVFQNKQYPGHLRSGIFSLRILRNCRQK